MHIICIWAFIERQKCEILAIEPNIYLQCFYKLQIDFRFPRTERFKITYFSSLIKCDSFWFLLWWFLYTVRALFRVCRTAQMVFYLVGPWIPCWHICLLIYLFVGQFLIVDLAIIWIWQHLKLTKLRIQFKSII